MNQKGDISLNLCRFFAVTVVFLLTIKSVSCLAGSSAIDMHGSRLEELQGQLQVALGDDDAVEVSRLLRKGAKANQPLDNSGFPPLMLAESLDVAKLLLKNGASARVVDERGGNLLHYAVTKNNALDLIPFFSTQGVDVDARNKEGYTPLLLVVEYFYETDAYQAKPVLAGKESLLLTGNSEKKSEPGPRDVLQALAAAGADLNAADGNGDTVLMKSVFWEESELTKILLELGADPAVRNKSGQTARDIAYEMGRRYIFQLLEQHMGS
jgi:ankyrin repeat protein